MAIDFENDLILITAASGRQAGGFLSRLASKAKRLRLQCVTSTSRERLEQQYPDAEVVQADFASLEGAKKLMDGVAVCFLITPAPHPREAHLGLNMVDAAVDNARKGGPFKHMIYSSVIHCCLRAMIHHDSKSFVEEALVESKLPYTVLQPTHQMDVVPIRNLVQQDEVVFKAMFNPETLMSFTNCHDIGEAVFNIFNDLDKHQYATYQLVSTPTLINYNEAMAQVSKVIGKEVRVERMTLDQSVSGFKNFMSDANEAESAAMLDGFGRMILHYEHVGLPGNSNVLKMLLGREPLGYRDWVEMQLK